MPNIELHGFKKAEGEDLRRKIFQMFMDRTYVEQMVIKVCTCDVEDVYRRPQPYIRLWSSPHDYVPEVLERLLSLNIDLEEMPPIKKFHPKSKSP